MELSVSVTVSNHRFQAFPSTNRNRLLFREILKVRDFQDESLLGNAVTDYLQLRVGSLRENLRPRPCHIDLAGKAKV